MLCVKNRLAAMLVKSKKRAYRGTELFAIDIKYLLCYYLEEIILGVLA